MSQVTRILVPTDFSAASDLAIDYAIDLACRYRASIHLVHVLEDVYLAGFPDGYVDVSGLRQQQEADATTRLGWLVRKCAAARLETSTAILTGNAPAVIVAEGLAIRADFIVMGTHGRTGLAHMFLGSVAERVIRSASCPVLTVRQKVGVQAVLATDAVAQREPVPILAAH
jgi:nucleotide-binding universal stress UspA family protein